MASDDEHDDTDLEEPVVLEIGESFDLHHFRPSEIIDVLDAYLDAALEAGLREVRLIHGRGKGVQRARVRRFLSDDRRIERFEEAPPALGGWGATIARLCRPPDPDRRDSGTIGHPAAAERPSPQHIFVGDVQGCSEELDELLERAQTRFGGDFVLHLVGDLVNRGPGNLRALARVRELVEAGRAHYVLGNHEIALLMVAFELRRLRPRDSFGDVLQSSEAEEWIEWLRRRPLAECGEIAGESFAMVHAALHPDWSLEDVARESGRVEARLGARDRSAAVELLAEDPATAPRGSVRDVLGRLTSCRSVCGPDWSSEYPGGEAEAWHIDWRRRDHAYGVVYGHWALQGLHLAPGLRGLDTGCVHHDRDHAGYLTAWLPGFRRSRAGLFDLPDDSLWQIPARRCYRDF